MKTALVITDAASKAFQIQQSLVTLGFHGIALNRIDPVFGCIERCAPDMIIVAELRSAGLTSFQVIDAIRGFSDATRNIPIIQLWSGLTVASQSSRRGPVATVVEPFTLTSARAAMEKLSCELLADSH